jgi:heterodisulfide reductase subunit B
MDATYFPGCSAHGTGIEYDRSTRAVCKALGAELHELEGWTCCGASSAHAVDDFLGLALPARNLALAEAAGRDVVVPCAACFHRLREAAHRIAETTAPIPPDVPAFAGRVDVLHLLDFLARGPLRATLRERMVRPLAGLPVVPYYGCLAVRPPHVTRAPDAEFPRGLDDLLADVGADVREWPYRTRCCGAGMTLPRADVVATLCGDLLDMARRAGAEAIAVACPLCFMNLDRQPRERGDLPVLYVTELLGVALGLPTRRWLRRHLVDPRPVLTARGLA